MQVPEIVRVLCNTYNPDQVARKGSEEALKKLEKVAGYQATLLKIITMDQVDLATRQAAILRLKNIIQGYWTIREGKANRISLQDRKIIKENLIEAFIFQKKEIIRVQLLQCLAAVTKGDFPQQWPELVPCIVKNLRSSDTSRVYGGLCALRIAFKRFQAPSMELARVTFPLILPIGKKLFDSPQSHEADEMLRQIIKTFFLATQFAIPPHVQQPAVASNWIQLLLQIFLRPVAPNLIPSNPTDAALSKVPAWKNKKWSGRIIVRLFSRFGNPKVCSKTDSKAFAEMIKTKWAASFLEAVLRQLKLSKAPKARCTLKVSQLCFLHLNNSIPYAAVFKLMKPHLSFIIRDCILGSLMLSDEDLLLWKQDPTEFVRKSLDISEDQVDPTIAASNLLIEMVRVRTGHTLKLVLETVQGVLAQYASSPPAQRNARLKDGVLQMLGALQKLLRSKKDYHRPVENILVKHVFPEFKSQYPFLRSRSCWLVGRFSKLEYSKPQHFGFGCSQVIECMRDGELPVQLEAAFALSRIIRVGEAVVKSLVPRLPFILEQFFKLINTLGSEDIVSTLATLIGHLGADVKPFAAMLIKRLTLLTLKLSEGDPEDDDEEAALTAMQCLSAINCVLYGLESMPEAYAPLEPMLAPVIDKFLMEERIDMVDDVLEMISCLTYFSHKVSPYMWSLLPRLVTIFHNWGYDFLQSMISIFDNYVSQGTVVLVESQTKQRAQNFMSMLMSIPAKLMTDKGREPDCQYACLLLLSIVGHCRFRIDSVMPSIIKLAGNKLMTGEDIDLKLMVCDILGACAHYNPQLFVRVCSSTELGSQFLGQMFNHWLSHLPHMKKSSKHLKMATLGLGSLFLLRPQSLPPLIQGAFSQILQQCFNCAFTLHEKVVNSVLNAGKEDKQADEPAQDEFENVNEDQDALDELIEYHQITDSLANDDFTVLGGEDGVDEFEDQICPSPIDEIDPLIFYATCMTGLGQKSPQGYQGWLRSLSPDNQKRFKAVMEEAAQRQREAQAKAK